MAKNTGKVREFCQSGKVGTLLPNFRVATVQGKQGIWLLLFPYRENTGNFVLTQGKNLLTQGKYLDCDY